MQLRIWIYIEEVHPTHVHLADSLHEARRRMKKIYITGDYFSWSTNTPENNYPKNYITGWALGFKKTAMTNKSTKQRRILLCES
jgi:hypothetical protein